MTKCTPSILVTRVVNDQGRVFNVVLVPIGGAYGRNALFLNEGREAMVEFYDAAVENDERFDKGRGQFITRYYLSTLTGRENNLQGLDLCGHVPEWKLTGQNVSEALAAIEATLHSELTHRNIK